MGSTKQSKWTQCLLFNCLPQLEIESDGANTGSKEKLARFLSQCVSVTKLKIGKGVVLPQQTGHIIRTLQRSHLLRLEIDHEEVQSWLDAVSPCPKFLKHLDRAKTYPQQSIDTLPPVEDDDFEEVLLGMRPDTRPDTPTALDEDFDYDISLCLTSPRATQFKTS